MNIIDDQMKITILQGAFLPVPPLLGGAVEKRWFALGKEFVRKGHEVVHISRKYENLPEEEWIDGVYHKRVGGYSTPSSGIYLKWLDLLYSLKAKSAISDDTDVIVTNTFWAPLVMTNRLRKRCMVDVARMPKGQMRLYYQAARLRANSSPVVQAIRREIPAKQQNRVVKIPNPIPFSKLPQVDFSIKEPEILYVGRLHPEKGVDLLVKASKVLPDGWKIKIIGPSSVDAGGGGEAYLSLLRQLNVSANIEFVGPVYDMNALNQYYARASVFVYPSVAEQGETFGLAPIEAMAWGCVPVVSDLACFKDFIQHEKNGLLFDHRDHDSVGLLQTAIKRLQSDSNLRNKLAQNALAVHKTHSISAVASMFIHEFREMNQKI